MKKLHDYQTYTQILFPLAKMDGLFLELNQKINTLLSEFQINPENKEIFASELKKLCRILSCTERQIDITISEQEACAQFFGMSTLNNVYSSKTSDPYALLFEWTLARDNNKYQNRYLNLQKNIISYLVQENKFLLNENFKLLKIKTASLILLYQSFFGFINKQPDEHIEEVQDTQTILNSMLILSKNFLDEIGEWRALASMINLLELKIFDKDNTSYNILLNTSSMFSKKSSYENFNKISHHPAPSCTTLPKTVQVYYELIDELEKLNSDELIKLSSYLFQLPPPEGVNHNILLNQQILKSQLFDLNKIPEDHDVTLLINKISGNFFKQNALKKIIFIGNSYKKQYNNLLQLTIKSMNYIANLKKLLSRNDFKGLFNQLQSLKENFFIDMNAQEKSIHVAKACFSFEYYNLMIVRDILDIALEFTILNENDEERYYYLKKTIEILIDHGLNVNKIKTDMGNSLIIHHATKLGNMDMLLFLKNQVPDFDIHALNQFYYNAISIRVLSPKAYDAIGWLIAEGVTLERNLQAKATPLQLHIIDYSEKISEFKFKIFLGLLIENGCQVNSYTCPYREEKSKISMLQLLTTPLHLAVMKKRISIVRQLLQQGAYINLVDGNGKTPMDLAKDGLYQNADIFEELLTAQIQGNNIIQDNNAMTRIMEELEMQIKEVENSSRSNNEKSQIISTLETVISLNLANNTLPTNTVSYSVLKC